jgi:hypothetical protein
MMKIITVFLIGSLALINLTNASPSDFPSFDTFHAHCSMEVSYDNQNCATSYANVIKVID